MKKLMLYLCCGLTLFSISGCGKKEEVLDKPVGFGDGKEIVETSAQESSEDAYAIYDNLGGQYDTKETTEVPKVLSDEEVDKRLQEVEESVEVYLKEIEEEKKEYFGEGYKTNEINLVDEYIIDSSGEEVYIEDVGNGLVGSMRDQIYDGLITDVGMSKLDSFIDENFPNESDETKQKIRDYMDYCWEDYTEMQESLAALPPEETWSEEELAENPDLKYYSRSEIDYLNKQLEEAGIEITN